MSIEYHDPSGSYENFRYDVMAKSWGETKPPVVDANGDIIIGPGFDLRADFDYIASVILGEYYSTFLAGLLFNEVNKVYAYGEDQLLQDRLNGVLDSVGGRLQLPPGLKFEFAGRGQMKTVLEFLAPDTETALANATGGLDFTEERAALFSLAFEAPGLIDPSLVTALEIGDRPEAWVEIRYGSNDGLSALDQDLTADRRYVQADVFGLYNDEGSIGFLEARDVAYAYGNHRLDILGYEEDFAPGKAVGTIYEALQGAIKSVAKEFGVSAKGLEEVLFVNGESADLSGDGTAFDAARNDGDLLVGDTRDNRLVGGGGNDVLIGLEGNDVLIGGGGKDTLMGGPGNDSLKGGNGNDLYIMSGGGTDKVVEKKSGGNDTMAIQTAGTYDAKNVERLEFDGSFSGEARVTLNQFEAFDLSGGKDRLEIVVNRIGKHPIEIDTGKGSDTVAISFDGVNPSKVLDREGKTAVFDFDDLSKKDTIDLTALGIKAIVKNTREVDNDNGLYLLAPGAKVNLMDGNEVDKTYDNNTDSWFMVRLGADTPYGPEFTGDIAAGNFDI